MKLTMRVATALLLAVVAWPLAGGTPPTISSFAASPTKLAVGQSCTLTWSVTNATTLSITGMGTVTGTSATVTPSASTLYTLTARNNFGSTTASVLITVGNLPKIVSITATPAAITTGTSATLAWNVVGATSVTINQGVGTVTGTSLKVTPLTNTTYTLTATNTFGSVTASVTISVGSLPVITSFAATPAMVPIGQSTTLTWAVTGATSLTINQRVGAVTGTSLNIKPSVTTSYVLTATNAIGSVTASVTVTVGPPPVILSFTASPANVRQGLSTTLTWLATNSPILTISPSIGTVNGTTLKVTPSATTVYTLTASSAFGAATASVTVTVGIPPIVSAFSATPPLVVAGQPSTLGWTVSGATTLAINQGVGAVTGTSVVVTPSTTTSYTLTAGNVFGTTTASVTVTAGSPPTITKFWASPANLPTGQSTTLSWVATGSPSLSIDQGVGAVAGMSIKVTPAATTSYTLTATNPFGTATASTTVAVGSPPTITNFTAFPAKVVAGQPSTLSWVVTGSPSLTISPTVGPVTGTSTTVSPPTTTGYTLTATNAFGSAAALAIVTAGSLPTITSFTVTPANLTPGQSATLSWSVSGQWGVSISPGIGLVTGTSFKVTPGATTTYVLTATNNFGSDTASATATLPPVIYWFFASPATVGPGQSTTLYWNTIDATSLSIDQGVGPVTGNSVVVNPTSAVTYTLTATDSAGSVTAQAPVGYVPLAQATTRVYYTEHVLFIIPEPGQVDWTASDTWDRVYSTANVNSYVNTLKTLFPSDYFFVVMAANDLNPPNAPSVQLYRHLADGIGENSARGVGVPNICRYNIGTGAVSDGAFGALDHEIGLNWGVFIGREAGDPHWVSNSTVAGPMADTGARQISGDPVNGFTWAAIDNITLNEMETFSDEDLYLQGFGATFPDLYVLTSPVYNADHTVSYSSVAGYDQAWVVQQNGVRNPSWQNSEKRLRMGFVYIARDLAEVQTVFQPIERSAGNFVNAEQIDTTNFRFQVPFLVETQYRASVDALLADLDGNATPTLSIPGPTSLLSNDGTATVPFIAADPDGPMPAVSCVPASPNCAIQGSNVVLTGLASGANFFTIKAQNAGGKKTFAHFVVDVQ